ncbi:hypothetical protein PAXINDRAFT_14520 [Paxillus involutus ATCC 200175]|uniref:Unplaced genomic scaffold PAXINscaffold_39, whole genome shotgun sequence n=1 Tax=Paxillus involutus ATCC 200175 TaxID=664439 RepID=A0A0C9TZ80_PAXIN|nr:hypothetical protein PAXINDRAFT_14520 [Paxillus involutus ATCC 200175]
MTPIPKPAAPADLQRPKRRKRIPEHLNQVAPHSQSPSPLLSHYHYQSHLLIASYATRPPPSALGVSGSILGEPVWNLLAALYAKANQIYDDFEASKWQVAQVSTPRTSVGPISDFTRNRVHFRVATAFASSRPSLSFDRRLRLGCRQFNLWMASSLVGPAYGGLFGICPTIVIEWFGLGIPPPPLKTGATSPLHLS